MHIGEAVLPKQDSVKYLSVIVDKQLSWKLPMTNVRRVCLRNTAATRRASVYLPMQVRQVFYSFFVIPTLIIAQLFGIIVVQSLQVESSAFRTMS